MSHDRGCLCGREKYEYEDCKRKDCLNQQHKTQEKKPEVQQLELFKWR